MHLYSRPYCKCLCTDAPHCGCPPPHYKVIHHSERQMTSPATPILQLLPFHPAHILRSNGLALCQHPPSSSSSSFPMCPRIQRHCAAKKEGGESAESSLQAAIYNADTGQAWLGSVWTSCECMAARFGIDRSAPLGFS